MSERKIRRAWARAAEQQERRNGRIGRKAALAAGAGLGATVLFAPAAEAATFPVTTTADSGAGSLRDAITAANAAAGADTITFASTVTGTITLASEIDITDALTIQGPGAGTLAISGADTTRIFYADTAGTLNISGLTLRDAYVAGNGAALYAGDADTTLTAVAFIENYAGSGASGDGGAVYWDDSNLTIAGSSFTGNLAGGGGGALYGGEDGYTTTITNSTFTGNLAYADEGGALYLNDGDLAISGSNLSGNAALDGGGGAIYADDGSVSIDATTIANNFAFYYGGGASFYGNDDVAISNSQITGNFADSGGGVTAYNDGSLSISASNISGNYAGDDWGGLAAYPGGALSIDRSTIAGNIAAGDYAGGLTLGSEVSNSMTNSTVSGNVAGQEVGGVAIYNSNDVPTTIANSTIVDNRMSADPAYDKLGAGISRYGYDDPGFPGDDTVTLSSTIVANNTGGAGDIGDFDGPPADGSFATAFSLIEDPGNATITETTAGSNITATDPLLGPLASNGGPTQTHLPNLGSPAIDAGIANGLGQDQRGFPRTADLAAVANRTGSDATDIGSVEVRGADCQGVVAFAEFRSTDGDDTLVGTDGADAISGLGGNDTESGLAGNDCLNGDDGDDILKGGSGKDLVKGGAGKDKVKGQAGKDKLKGAAGNDRLSGSGGKDKASGGAGKDRVSGGKGKDRLKGNAGKDTLRAADGKVDRVNCGGGKDKATVDAKDKVSNNCEQVTVR